MISASPSDVSPVFRAIVRNATRLCDATFGTVFRFDGELITVAANQDLTPEEIAITNTVYPAPATRGLASGRAIIERRVVHIPDIRSDPDYVARPPVNAPGYRTALAVPMLREGSPIGVFVMWRREVKPFTDKQIALVETFADQAVIAIENVRLFNETKEALEQQTAASDILSVISRSPTDVQPVFDAVAESAARLCEAQDASIFRRAGDQLLFAAHHGPIPFGRVGEYSMPLVRETLNGRCVLEGRTMQVADLQIEGAEFPQGSALARRWGYRTVLNVPLMRDRVAIGSISLRRTEVKAFTERQIALLQTFADQAVIAIENVRLFKELETSNRDLTTSLEQQTATSELLKVIGRSTFDLQPVFETLAQNTVRLCEAQHALIFRFDGQILKAVAAYNISPELRAFNALNPIAPSRGSCAGRVVLERRTVHIHDAQADPEYTLRRETSIPSGP